jgi:hypothetical protein
MLQAVGIETGYGLDGRGVGGESHWGEDFSSPQVQTGSGVHPVSYPVRTGGFFSEVKRPGRQTDHSAPTRAEVNNTWIFTPTFPYAFMA